jgi:histidyl-tRNA synthetase
VTYLSKFENDLSADSKIRLHKNPLRILDSKDEGDKKIVAGAPSLQSCLNDDSKKFFDQVLHSLTIAGVPYKQNQNLVRGLDYYVHTVFEFTTDHLGAQGTLIAGGRYDGLVEKLGGPATAGFGWAGGIERLMLLTDPNMFIENKKVIAIIPADETADDYCLKLTQQLRERGHTCELVVGNGNVGKKMKRANKINADYAFIAGGKEISEKIVAVKNLKTGDQKDISINKVIAGEF